MMERERRWGSIGGGAPQRLTGSSLLRSRTFGGALRATSLVPAPDGAAGPKPAKAEQGDDTDAQ